MSMTDFEVAENNKTLIEQRQEPTIAEKSARYNGRKLFRKNFTPWYRSDEQIYVVTKVCIDLNASSMFPSEEFENYESYFKEKYDKVIINRDQPLLLLKSISKRLNCLRPCCSTNQRSREKIYEDVKEHLILELCVKRLPGALWIQSTLLLTILHRITSLLQADQLRNWCLIKQWLIVWRHYGFQGLLKWFEIIPASENIDNLLNMVVPNPILNKNATIITSYIFESGENSTPGELTDLRSALNFVDYQESKNYKIDEYILILLEADDLHLTGHVDVPKVLSGMSLEAVWKVLLCNVAKQIETFKSNVPKNAVGPHSEFEAAVTVDGERTMVELNFMLNSMKKSCNINAVSERMNKIWNTYDYI
ncbi:hypothetical protein FQA39_LY08015 [Lamprigera yunnana]|nr:hypothetical protein FQA39_LY08015 [Lamprigera yunnana]